LTALAFFSILNAMGNIFGQLFRISTFGESHGGGVGVVVDGCPPKIELSESDIQPDLDRRRPGQSKIVSPRKEADKVEILSGVFEGKTLGTPICMLVRNEDARPEAYTEMKTKFRPSHADYTYQAKYGIRAWPGGGRTSARETIGRVAAGAIAKKILRERYQVEVLAYVKQVQGITADVDSEKVQSKEIESNIVRCPDAKAAEKMIRLIEEMRQAGEEYLASYDGFSSIDGSAESTTLDDNSVDFVTAGQSFHWFEPDTARREFARILKPGGWMVIAWNDRRIAIDWPLPIPEDGGMSDRDRGLPSLPPDFGGLTA